MDIIALILVMGISLALLFGIPFGIAWFYYQKMKERNVSIFWRWTAVIPALLILFLMGRFLFPDKHSYQTDYWEVTAAQFPAQADIVFIDSAAKPEDPGFYFGFATTLKDFNNKIDLLKRRGFTKDSITPTPVGVQQYMKENGLVNIGKFKLSRYPRWDYYADFLSDSSTIFLRKVPK